MVEYLKRLFRYDAWANREALRAVEAARGRHARATQLLAHIVAAEWLWLKRLGQGKAMAVWPELTLAECGRELEELRPAWERYLDALTEAGLSAIVEYRNTKGEHWTNTRQDVLMHVVMHSAYHRGQIAAALRAQGQQPAYTDFIEAVRRGLIA